MKYCILKSFALLLFLSPVIAFSQYTFTGEIQNFQKGHVTITKFYGEEKSLIDTIFVDSNGIFKFDFPGNSSVGIYQMKFKNGKYFDFIFNNENIKVLVDYNNPQENVDFIESDENKNFYAFLRSKIEYQHKHDLIFPIVNFYPKEEEYYSISLKQFISNEKGQLDFEKNIIKKYPDSYIARIVKMQQTMPIPDDLSLDDKSAYVKEHYFEYSNFSDTMLLYSKLIPSKLIDYLSLYSSKNFNKKQQEDAFIQAVDQIMLNTIDEPKIYEFVLDYLIKGFRKFNFDNVIDYIAENNSLEKLCINSEKKEKLQKELDNIKYFAVGKIAPDFTVEDIYGKKITLSEIKSDYTIILFWASWCPHCMGDLPVIKQYYDRNNTIAKIKGVSESYLEIIAISLDTDKEAFSNAVSAGQFNWINCVDFKSWEGELAMKYCVYATPTMFLLDKDKKIVAKPISARELEDSLPSLFK